MSVGSKSGSYSYLDMESESISSVTTATGSVDDRSPSEEEFEVEKILKERTKKGGKLQYFVKWKGYGEEHNSWEPYENVKECTSAIKDFEQPWIKKEEREMVIRAEARRNRNKQGDLIQIASSSSSHSKRDNASIGGRGGGGASSSNSQKGKGRKKGSGSIMAISTSYSQMEQAIRNPVILGNVFEMCPWKLLANCRLVCKEWYRISLVAWRHSSIIVLRCSENNRSIYLNNEEDAEEEDDDDTDMTSKTSIHELLDFLEEQSPAKPYCQFDLFDWTFGTSSSKRKQSDNAGSSTNSIKWQQDRFWEVVGADMTALILSSCNFKDATEFRRIVFQTCPNLKTLDLDNCSSSSPRKQPKGEGLVGTTYMEPLMVNLDSLTIHKDQDQKGPNLPVTHLELLSHFPSLRCVNLTYEYEETRFDEYAYATDLLAWLNAIKAIRRHDGDTLPIEKFNVDPGLEIGPSQNEAHCREIWDLVQELDLPLSSLVIQVTWGVDMDLLKDTISKFGKGIQKIDATEGAGIEMISAPNPARTWTFPCQFPFGVELGNLTELTLSATFCNDMGFLKWTPNLEKLHIIPSSSNRGFYAASVTKMVSKTDEASMDGMELLQLKELWFGYKLTEEDVRRLSKWMPNIEILTIFLDDWQFGIVCENWGKLEHLHVLGKHLGDAGITGMRFYDYAEDGFTRVEVTRPNISSLKELRCFQLAISDSTLSDASVYNGFLKLPNLESLDIASYKSKIGDEAMTALHDKIPKCKVICKRSPARAFGLAPSYAPNRIFNCEYFC